VVDQERGAADRNERCQSTTGSHGADAFRYLSLSWKEPTSDDGPMTIKDIIAEMINPRSIAQMLEETELAELRTGQDETLRFG
jgi:hypothetical protein